MSVYEKIYEIVRGIPRGKVATYGQVARAAGRCTPRMVGYAMAALSDGTDVPWHRVVNHKGEVSPRAGGSGHLIQRALLEDEGVPFNESGRIDLNRYQWAGEAKAGPHFPSRLIRFACTWFYPASSDIL